jgi:hypothetical protein
MQNGIIEAPLLQNYALSGEKTFLTNAKFINISKKKEKKMFFYHCYNYYFKRSIVATNEIGPSSLGQFFVATLKGKRIFCM